MGVAGGAAQHHHAVRGCPTGREADMVGLVANGARPRQRHRMQYPSVSRRIGVEVDDGDKVRSLMCLISGPYEKRCFRVIGLRECEIRNEGHARDQEPKRQSRNP